MREITSGGGPSGGARAGERPGRLVMLGWGVAGFLIGAAVWNVIGLWAFVGDVVLRGHPDDARAVQQTGQSCTELALDRARRLVEAVPCPSLAPQLAESVRGTKGDSERPFRERAVANSRWPVRINAEEPDEGGER